MDSRHDEKYEGLGKGGVGGAPIPENGEMSFAPLPDYAGGFSYFGEGADAQSQAAGYGTQQYYASTQGSQSSAYSQDLSSYMGGGSSQGGSQGGSGPPSKSGGGEGGGEFSQESGYSDYYFDGEGGGAYSQDSER